MSAYRNPSELSVAVHAVIDKLREKKKANGFRSALFCVDIKVAEKVWPDGVPAEINGVNIVAVPSFGSASFLLGEGEGWEMGEL